jgi:hypothetical protein
MRCFSLKCMCGRIFAQVLLCTTLLLGDPARGETLTLEAELTRQVLGIIIAGEEVDTLEVLQDGNGYLLPLDSILRLLRAELVQAPPTARVRTPLGEAALPDLYYAAPQWFVHSQDLAAHLKVLSHFDARKYALILDPPWRKGRQEKESTPDSVEITPDFVPPSFGLAGLRLDAHSDYREHSGFKHTLSGEFDGRLGGGEWYSRLDVDADQEARLGAYYWRKTTAQHQYLLGKLSSPNPYLLPTFAFTGAQVLFSSAPLNDTLLSPTAYGGVRQFAQTSRDIEGRGPPAGIAELRIDDRVIARTRIGLDGRYHFRDLNLPNSHFIPVEVLLYERDHRSVPLAREDYSYLASTTLLPAGLSSVLLGGGGAGDWLDKNNADRAQVGFIQWQRGVREDLSVQMSVQKNSEKAFVSAGLLHRLGRHWLVSAASAYSDGAAAYQLEFEGGGRQWQWHNRFKLFDEGFSGAAAHAYFSEYRYEISPSLQVSVLGRDELSTDTHARFVLPAAVWRPWPTLRLSARPNRNGDYRYDGHWRVHRQFRLSHTYEDKEHLTDWEYEFNHNLSFYAVHRRAAVARDEAGIYWRLPGPPRHSASMQAALLRDEKEGVGYRLRLHKNWGLGWLSSVEINHLPGAGVSANLNLVAEFTASGTRLLPGRGLYGDKGGIAAHIQARGEVSLALDEARLLINGAPRDARGSRNHFVVNDLSPGIYQVALDTEKLPIELSPETTHYWVEVARNAITPVTFWVRPEYGVAGRVRDHNGAPLPDIVLEVRDSAGQIQAQVRTDQFGLYRVDGLPSGIYHVRARDGNGAREIEIRDDFLFEQDFQRAATSDSSKNSTD